jgi:hypothetical protein
MTPRLMLPSCIQSGQIPAYAGDRNDENRVDLLRTFRKLLTELESSLYRSHKVLLALDVSGVERGTGEQIRLVSELTVVKARIEMEPPAAAKLAGNKRFPDPAVPELEQQVRLSAQRILQASRLQAAILARYQAKLRVLGNMLAGSSVHYDPISVRDGRLQHCVAAR